MPGSRFATGLLAAAFVAACGSATDDRSFATGPFGPLAPGGTHLTRSVDASSGWPGEALTESALDDGTGRDLFYRNWLTEAQDRPPILGPRYDAVSCTACHVEMARPGVDALDARPPLIARTVMAEHLAEFGPQLQRFRTDRAAPAFELEVTWTPVPFTYPDGTEQSLRSPQAHALTDDGRRIPVGLRAAPLLFGWGLMERIDPDMLAYYDDPYDRNGDGISGRSRPAVRDDGSIGPGLLGWKNAHASLTAQVRAALVHDMGITSVRDCRQGCDAELSEPDLHALTDFVRGIGVPQHRLDGQRRGQDLFGQAGCAQCHVPVVQTLPDPRPELDRQWLWAYSDLMLHDMGPGLADPGDNAEGREWRTAPLWGVGLAERFLTGRGFLHDGRARTLEEAILWHGGEAAEARDAFARLPAGDRHALLEFVRSL
ncbi:thiol oxidoreductase [Wenzhouxiangella sp. XN79A]|uniref:di-heme oxidoredictase family protein n=1 Tax=Wenzhouxiangella sp. XN79A TaxID=2724193 RepID=UPI00144AAAAB|nr:di-heme oxidoredictase family protein [Wenzhouxiangella sp. XN79A]NKI35372.1 thiol oxidoreductase [Wenzhouxiangella sp. XN79A]